MSQHGCPERLSNRSKGFQEDGGSQATMEVFVETLTGTAFEMTVSPSDTIFAIKSKIYRVEGIPVSQQQLVYNLRELEDASSLRALGIADGARLRLVLRMRGGPVSSRRLPAAAYRDLDQLLDPDRDDVEWSSGCGGGGGGGGGVGGGCRVTLVVFRDGERVNMLRVRHNPDGTYSPIDHHNCDSAADSPSHSQSTERLEDSCSPPGSGSHNAVTMGKMMELRRRMESLSVRRHVSNVDKAEIHKTRSEELLAPRSVSPCGGGGGGGAAAVRLSCDCDCDCHYDANTQLLHCAHADDRLNVAPAVVVGAEAGGAGGAGAAGALPLLDECSADLPDLPVHDYGQLVGSRGGGGWRGRGFGSSSQLAGAGAGAGAAAPAHARSASSLVRAGAGAPPQYRKPQLSDALFSSSTSDLESLRRHRLLPTLARHRNTEHLHLSDTALDLRRPPPPPPEENQRKVRLRCNFCKKKLTIATVHKCRCGVEFCAPHRYAEVHGCAYDYKAHAHAYLQRANPLVSAPKLPKI